MANSNDEFQYTNTWFDDNAKRYLSTLLPSLLPKRILEIGCYEGRSTCFFIDTLAKHVPLELHCVDNFRGGWEHQDSDMNLVMRRFFHNVGLATKKGTQKTKVTLHRTKSDLALARLLSSGMENYFDFIYVDGSHDLQDVLLDAILCFKMLREGGVIGFDDYTWGTNNPSLWRSPKIAIDYFTVAHWQNLRFLNISVSQVYLQKLPA